jgi:hypothetical protein
LLSFLQLVPFVYMFGALVKFAVTESMFRKGQYGRVTMFLAGLSGFLTTILGIALVFFPGAADHVNCGRMNCGCSAGRCSLSD